MQHTKLKYRDLLAKIVIIIYSLSCLGQETEKEPFSFPVKLPPVYHTQWKLHTVPFIAERQAGKLWISVFIVFGLTRPKIKSRSTASAADALSTRPLDLTLLWEYYLSLFWAVFNFSPISASFVFNLFLNFANMDANFRDHVCKLVSFSIMCLLEQKLFAYNII